MVGSPNGIVKVSQVADDSGKRPGTLGIHTRSHLTLDSDIFLNTGLVPTKVASEPVGLDDELPSRWPKKWEAEGVCAPGGTSSCGSALWRRFFRCCMAEGENEYLEQKLHRERQERIGTVQDDWIDSYRRKSKAPRKKHAHGLDPATSKSKRGGARGSWANWRDATQSRRSPRNRTETGPRARGTHLLLWERNGAPALQHGQDVADDAKQTH